MPYLEQLGPRDCLSPFVFTELRAPASPLFALAPENWTADLLFLGQFPQLGVGIPYLGPSQIIRWDITDQQWSAIMHGAPLSVAREVIPVFGGQVAVVFTPDGVSAAAGLAWEQAALLTGNWYADPLRSTFPNDTYDVSRMPAGPQAGQWFAPPEFLLADWLYFAGDVVWPAQSGTPAPAPSFAPPSLPPS